MGKIHFSIEHFEDLYGKTNAYYYGQSKQEQHMQCFLLPPLGLIVFVPGNNKMVTLIFLTKNAYIHDVHSSTYVTMYCTKPYTAVVL